ncbi:hypothetical protein Tco_0590414, partial [Tanacetum coccineum]
MNCDNKNHFIGECPKPKKNKAFIGGAWSDSEDGNEPQKEAKCLMAIDSQEVVEPCEKCDVLTQEVDSLKCNVSRLQDEALNFSKFKNSSIVLDDMLSRQIFSQDKEGLGFSKDKKTTFEDINKTPYEILRGMKPSLEYFRVFGCRCVISKSLESPTLNDSTSYNGIFLGYSQTLKAYILLNKETLKMKESLNVTFGESLPKYKTSSLVDDDVIEEHVVQNHNRTQNPNYDLEEVIPVESQKSRSTALGYK